MELTSDNLRWTIVNSLLQVWYIQFVLTILNPIIKEILKEFLQQLLTVNCKLLTEQIGGVTLAERFKFGLEKLLEIRMAKEEESKRLFTESQREKKKIEEKLEELNENLQKYKGISPNEDVIYQKLKRYYIQGLQNGIQATEKDLETKEQEVNVRRRELTVKQMERKTVQTLKEKKYSAYVKEQDRIEQINLDELALYAYVRNSGNEN